MNKVVNVAWIVGIVIIVYLFLLVAMPVISSAVSSGNLTMAATSNMSNYPGTTETMLIMPWILWFVPGVGGIIAVVLVLRQRG